MKKLIVLSIILILNSTFLIFNSFAQAPPEGINYQAVARNVSGNTLAAAALSIQFTIHDLSPSGLIVYQETHSVTTNIYGLFTAVIGKGTQISTGNFSSINWGLNDKFLEVEVNDGSGLVSMGSTQMMSVPYALYAKNAGSGTNGVSITWLGSLATQPTSPSLNQAYYNTTNKKSYVYDGTAWQILSQDGINGTNGTNGVSLNWLGSLATAPTSPSLNQAYYNSTNKKSFVYDGTTWQILAQDGLAGAANINGTAGNIIKFTGPTSGGNSKIVEDASGNIGIGTATPGYQLDVTGSGRYTGKLTVGAYTLPATDGTTNQVLKTNGTGTLTWSFDNGNTYTNGTGLDLTANTFSLTATGVTQGTYGNASTVPKFSVDAQGRITSVTNTPITLGPQMPFGSLGQTLYNAGGYTWNVTSNLFNNGTAVSIGTGAVAAASSILDIGSTNKGLLIPRIALTSILDVTTITSPATSLLIYNTASAGSIPNDVVPGFYYFNGSKWIPLGGIGAGGLNWALNGNAGTIPGANFIGTTDLKHLVFKTNSLERMKIDSIGNVGVGIPNPKVRLDVGGIVAMSGFRMPTGAIAGNVLTSDGLGNGTWQPAGSASGWTLNGNAGTLATNFIGTTDANDFVLKANNVEMVRLKGNNSAAFTAGQFQINTSTNTNPGVIISGSTFQSRNLNMQASAAQTAVGSNLGAISFSDFGNSFNQAMIQGQRDGAGGTPTDLPTALVFFTTPDGTGGAGTELERMRISNNGNVSIGTAIPAKNKLTVKGSMAVNRILAPATYTITSNDYIVELVVGTALILPPSSSVDDGTILIIRNRFNSGATLNRSGSDTILLLGSTGTVTTTTIAANLVLRLYLSASTWVEW